MSQPTVSRHVSDLETRLGVRLLSRTTRVVTPTDAGRAYYERVSRAIGELSEATHEVVAGGEALVGMVRVAAPSAFGRRFVVPAIERVLEQHAEVRVEALLSDLSIDLVAEGVDIAVRIVALGPGTFSQKRLGDARQVVVASPAYLQRRGVPESISDLANHEAVLATTTRSAMSSMRASGMIPQLPEIPLRYVSDDIDSVAELARAGLGVSVLPLWMVSDDITSGRLERLLQDLPIPGAPIVALWSSGRQLPRRARAVLDQIHAFVQSDPATRSA